MGQATSAADNTQDFASKGPRAIRSQWQEAVNDQGQIGETISAKSFTEIILYGKIFSLTDTWAEVEPPSYSVTSFVFISGLSLVPTLRRQTRVQEKTNSSRL